MLHSEASGEAKILEAISAYRIQEPDFENCQNLLSALCN